MNCVALFGGAGRLGRHVASELQARGMTLRMLVRSPQKLVATGRRHSAPTIRFVPRLAKFRTGRPSCCNYRADHSTLRRLRRSH